jgi:hypothetical protein
MVYLYIDCIAVKKNNKYRCPRMSAHILNIFNEKINRARRVRFSPHDSGTVNVLRTTRIVNSVEGITPQMWGTLSGHLNTGWTLCEQERELRSKCSEMETGGGKLSE